MMLIAYDDDGNIVGTLDYLNHYNPDGTAYRIDFEAHADDLLAVWKVDKATGSKVWPGTVKRPKEWRVEKAGPEGNRHIAALVHKETGERIEP
jgi:hypothetical protein